jgi:hypothetical protein
MPASASRSVYLIDRYWADSTGRRNTFVYILFEQPVECLCRRLPVERFAWPCVQGVGDSAQLFSAMTAEISALGKVLAKQTVGIFIAAALPRALRVAEVDFEASVDPKLSVLCHLDALISGQGAAQM